MKKKVLHLVCNAHIDPVWQWDWNEGVTAALATFWSAAELAEEFDYIFCHNEALLYEYIEKYAPDLFEKIRVLAAAGKWHVTGGWYLQPDCDLPSGEAFIRTIMLGKKYFKEKFGKEPTTAVNYDSFGHSRGLVQILAKCGYDSYVFCRPLKNMMALPDSLFTWKGYDGSSVTAVRIEDETIYCSELGKAKSDILRKAEQFKNKDTGLILWGVGNHGGGASRKDLRDIEELKAEKKDEWEIVHSTPEEYFKAVKPTIVLEKSLYPCFVKAYTSMNSIKQKHIELENRIFITEKLAALAALCKKQEYDRKSIEQAEKALACLQFHDVFSGTCTEDGERSSLQKAAFAEELLNEVYMKAFLSFADEHRSAAAGEYPMFVFNSSPYVRETVLEGEFLAEKIVVSDTRVRQVKVRFDGRDVPSQLIKEVSNINGDRRKRVAIRAALPPFSVSRFDCRLEYAALSRPVTPEGDIVFDDGIKRAVIDRTSGLLTGFRVGNREYLAGGSFGLYMYDDNADPWGWHMRKVGKRCRPFRLSACKKGIFEGLKNVRITEDGAVFTEVECLFEGGASFARISYKFYKGLPYADVQADVFWNEREKALKLGAEFVSGGDFTAQETFGKEKMPKNGDEFFVHRFVAAEFGKEALAVLNDCTYGAAVSGNKLYYTLLNGSAYCAHPVEDRPIIAENRFIPFIEAGRHRFGFRMGVFPVEELENAAAEFNDKLPMLNVFPHGNGEITPPAVRISERSVCMEAFGKCGQGWFIRLFNNNAEKHCANIEICGKCARAELKAFEVKTFLFDGERIAESGIVV